MMSARQFLVRQCLARVHQCRYTSSTTSSTPIKRYSSMLELGVMKTDQSQFAAMLQLQKLFNNIKSYNPDQLSKDSNQPRGLYLHGGVGTGKTMLLDIFYDSIPTEKKKRVHFNAFMLYLYSEINRWNLCCDENVDHTSPVEHIANKIMQDTWLLCFDEIQISDYASFTLLEGVLGYMISQGAVIVGTSNRSPEELSNSSISGENDEVEVKKPSSFYSLFAENCDIHHVESERDHRMEMHEGECRFLYPVAPENKKQLDMMFAKLIEPGQRISSEFLEIYNRKILIPVACGEVARFHFKELFMRPYGPADYIKICNEYSHIFIDEIPRMTINQKNEARRLLTFIDAAYETRAKIYCTAESTAEDLFMMLPRNDENYEVEQMHLEMIGEIAYDLKLAGLDFKSLNLISGEDEIFSFRRAISRLNEMQSEFYQTTEYRKQLFVPYIGTEAEKINAEEKRRTREKMRLQKQAKEQDAQNETQTEEDWSIPNRDYKETDWGDEASYTSLSQEAASVHLKRHVSERQKDAPKFGAQHFWGFGWWEHVKNKIKKKNETE